MTRLFLLREIVSLATEAVVLIEDEQRMDPPGEMVAGAVFLADLAHRVVSAAVVAERERGTSWRVIGGQLPNARRPGETGVTAQAAEGAHGDAVREWTTLRDDPLAPRDEVGRVVSPSALKAGLREWADEYGYNLVDAEPAHPSAEVANLISLITEAASAGWTGERLAAVYDRRAAAFERLAALGDNPGAVEKAAADRARAAELRARE